MSRFRMQAAAALLVAGLMTHAKVASAQEFAPAGGAIVDGSGEYEVLTSGPIHEAFANPYSPDPLPGMVVAIQPPDPIDETPPDVVPEGPNMEWIPGYWGWDLEREGFVWISGVWRSVPPRQQWIPGYWAQVEDGFQWVSGFWTNEDVQELVYLPYPPESQEQGPTSPQPSPDYFWVPGIWMFEGNRYQWRPGHWSPAYGGWVWVPARYIWTPYGAVYTNGFWDRGIVERGMLFCPVVFHQPDIVFARYQFTPMVVVDTRPLLVHLFVSPRYNHYFFGDYYGHDFGHGGLFPWYSSWGRAGYYDPLLTYYDWSYGRRNINFIQRLQVWNQYFITNVSYRPPRTFSEQRRFFDRFGRDRFGRDRDGIFSTYALSQPLDEFVSDHGGQRRFHRLQRERRDELVDLTRETRRLQQQRAEREASLGARLPGRTDTDVDRPAQVRQPRTLELSALDRVRRERSDWRGRVEQEQSRQTNAGRTGRADQGRGASRDRAAGERGGRAEPAEILPELPSDAVVPQGRAGRTDDDDRPGRGPGLPGARPGTAEQPGRGEPRIGARDRDDRGQPQRGRGAGESAAERAQDQRLQPGFGPRTDDQPDLRRGQPGRRDLQPGFGPRTEDRPGQQDERERRPGFTPGATRERPDQPGRSGRTGQPPTLEQLRERMQSPRGDAQRRETRRPEGVIPGAQPGNVPQHGQPAQRPELTPSGRPGQTPGVPSLDELRQRGRSGQTPPPGEGLRQQESRFRGQPGFGQPGTQSPRTVQPAGPRPGAFGRPGAPSQQRQQPGREIPRLTPQPGRGAPAAQPAAPGRVREAPRTAAPQRPSTAAARPQPRSQPAAQPQARPQQRSQPAARPQARPQQRSQPAARPQAPPQRSQPAAQPQRGSSPGRQAAPSRSRGRSDSDDRKRGKGKGKD